MEPGWNRDNFLKKKRGKLLKTKQKTLPQIVAPIVQPNFDNLNWETFKLIFWPLWIAFLFLKITNSSMYSNATKATLCSVYLFAKNCETCADKL